MAIQSYLKLGEDSIQEGKYRGKARPLRRPALLAKHVEDGWHGFWLLQAHPLQNLMEGRGVQGQDGIREMLYLVLQHCLYLVPSTKTYTKLNLCQKHSIQHNEGVQTTVQSELAYAFDDFVVRQVFVGQLESQY